MTDYRDFFRQVWGQNLALFLMAKSIFFIPDSDKIPMLSFKKWMKIYQEMII